MQWVPFLQTVGALDLALIWGGLIYIGTLDSRCVKKDPRKIILNPVPGSEIPAIVDRLSHRTSYLLLGFLYGELPLFNVTNRNLKPYREIYTRATLMAMSNIRPGSDIANMVN